MITEKLIKELVSRKAKENNQIDLHAYENGMRALIDYLDNKSIKNKEDLKKELKRLMTEREISTSELARGIEKDPSNTAKMLSPKIGIGVDTLFMMMDSIGIKGLRFIE